MDDHTSWWATPVEPAHLGRLARKYAILLALVRDRDRARRDLGLREAARQWPGSLRECQRVSPDLYVQRLRACRRGMNAPPVPRSVWRSRNCAGVPLWAVLHDLLGDQLACRAVLRSTHGCGPSGSPLDVHAFVAMLRPKARARWPAADALERLGGPRLGPRHAYAWLAHRAELTMAQLDALLLAR
jgi:hypothetical protein